MENKFNPVKGETVSVCYDGKSGRAVDGVVLQRRGFALQVRFKEWTNPNGKAHDSWFVRTRPNSFGGYLRTKDSLMNMMFGKECPGDWYSVFPHMGKNK